MKPHPPALRLLALLLAVSSIVLFTPRSAQGASPTLIVPDGAASFEISDHTLAASLPPSAGPILQVSPAGRGSLTDRGTSYLYVPTSEFFDRGSDSFQVEYSTGAGTTAWFTVSLVAAMRTGWDFHLTLEDPDPLADAILSDPQAITLNDFSPIDGDFDLLFNLEPGISTFVRPRKPGVSPGGGKIGGGIDPGGGRGVPVGEYVLAAAFDPAQPNLNVAELRLSADLGALHISAAVAANRAKISSPAIPAGLGEQWELHWWAASAPSSRDGGALLLVDGVIGATLTDLNNFGATASDWFFGALDNDGVAGVLQLDNLVAAEALTTPRFAPIFADNFEGSHRPWKISSCQSDSGPTSQALAGTLQLFLNPAAGNPASGFCYLGHELLEPVRHLRTRFEVDLDEVLIGTADRFALLRGLTETDEAVLHVRLREHGGGVQLRADTDLDDGSRASVPWMDLPASGFVTVEAQWWASPPATSDGGLRLWIDGVLVGSIQGLANGSRQITRTDLGTLGVDPGASGTVLFDDFELWR